MVVPLPIPAAPDPLGIPNVFVTDTRGRSRYSAEVPNPFPEPVGDDGGLRIVGIVVAYHSDHQNRGACASRFGAGVDTHAVFNTLVDGTGEITDLVTVEEP